MKIQRFLGILAFLFLLITVGRLWAGVAFVVTGFFFLTALFSLSPFFIILVCFCIDLFFFLPFGMSLILLGIAHLLFPFFRGRFVSMVLFFFLFYVLVLLFFPHFSFLKMVAILFFPILLHRIQIYRSKMYEVG